MQHYPASSMSQNNNWHRKKKAPKKEDNYVPPYDATFLAKSTDTLTLSPGLSDKLKAGKIETFYDITRRYSKDFYKISTFNKKDLLELQNAIKPHRIAFRPDEVIADIDCLVTNKQEANNKTQLIERAKPFSNKIVGESPPSQMNRSSSNTERNQKQPYLNTKDATSHIKQNEKQRSAQPVITNKAQFNQQSQLSKTQSNFIQSNKDRQPDKPFTPSQSNQRQQPNNKTETQNTKNINLQKKASKTPIVEISEKGKKDERDRHRPKKRTEPIPTDIYVKINRGGKWGFVDRSGKEIVAPLYDELFSFKEELCCVEKDDLFGFINRKGVEVIPIEYDFTTSFSEGYACVCRNGSCGYIDKNNNVIVDFKYDAGTAVTDGSCRVKKDGKWGELIISNPFEVRWII
ncbi:MAG: WG repeat-containing protein [Christensenellaceae bacterium]|nr:WG repeat-containing protein [Christensenellaceae bacterium]